MIQIPADLNGPQADLLQQVLVGNESLFAAQTTMDGSPTYIVVARGQDAIRELRARLYRASSTESEPESPLASAKRPVPVTTGGSSAEPSTRWDETMADRVVKPEP